VAEAVEQAVLVLWRGLHVAGDEDGDDEGVDGEDTGHDDGDEGLRVDIFRQYMRVYLDPYGWMCRGGLPS